jgi:hypothetical protein
MSQGELCERHAEECLQAAGQSEDPLTREMLLRLALDWGRDRRIEAAGAPERNAAPGTIIS